MDKIYCGVSGTDTIPETHRLSEVAIDADLKNSLIAYYGKDIQLRPAQDTAFFEYGILTKPNNVIIATPTNSGKSLISYLLLLNDAFHGKRVVLIEPLRALAYEKGEELKAIIAEIKKQTKKKIKIVVTTGDYRMTDETMFSKPGKASGTCGEIIIATPERLDAISRMPENKEWFGTISAVVMDEAHLIGDSHRGATIELLLTYLRLLPSKPRLILMSATISNTTELAAWMEPCMVIENVPRYPQLNKYVYMLAADEKPDDVLINELQTLMTQENTSAIVFVYQTASAESLANKIAEKLSGKKNKKKDLSVIMAAGVAWFHSKLSVATKEAVIKAMAGGSVRVTVSTTALAMGINLPATHVYVRDISFTGYKDLDVSDLMQMLGRAGRGNINGIGVVMLSGANISKASAIIQGITNETLPCISSQMIPPEREGYFGSARQDEHYLDQACAQIMGILGRTGAITENALNQYLVHTLGGKQFTDLYSLLQRLSRLKLAYLDEDTREYQLTRLGKIGSNCYMPPSAVANIGQFIRDLLGSEPSGLHLMHFSAIDYLIMLCLTTDEIHPITRHSKAMEIKIEGFMEALPLQEKSYLYRQWIKSDPTSIVNSARVSVPDRDARKIAMCAVFTAMFLYDLSRGRLTNTMNSYYGVETDELQEKYRDNAMWLLCGLEKMMEVRCFYYHLKENCDASVEDIQGVDRALKRSSHKIFQIIGNLKFRSVLGEMIRGIKRVYPNADSYPSEGTIRKLETAGIISLRDLVGKKAQDLVSIGVKREYADLITGYIKKRSQ